MGGRQRSCTPIAVRRIEHEDFFGALFEPVPELQQVNSRLGPLADTNRRPAGSPELLEPVSDQLPFLRFKQRDALRLAGGAGIDGKIATGKIRRRMIAHKSTDIGRMHRFDAEAADLFGGELERDIVALGAQRRLARIDDIDGELVRGLRGRGAERGDQADDGAGERTRRPHGFSPWLHKCLRNSPPRAAPGSRR
jgi:hypothetical protein